MLEDSGQSQVASGKGITALGVDYGGRRIGVAVGSRESGAGSPLGVVANRDDGPDWDALDRWVKEWRPDVLVVGKPVNLDGTSHPLAPRIQRFCEQLSDRYTLPVARVDERLSSFDAQDRLREARQSGRRGRKIQKGDIDAMSAAILLENWFSETTHE
ncbi:MAG: Holliday junction resolvase RuvX [Thioalkalivibrio sp.]